VHRRPPLESRPEVEAALEAVRWRTARLKLADESATRAVLNGTLGEAPPAEWMRLLATLPDSAAGRVAATLAAERKGTLDPKTKAIIAWVSARHDRAWYALGHARERLRSLGFRDDQIFALDRPETLESPADREVVKYAAKITVNPAQADDDDIARLRKLFDDKKVAEVVFQVTQAAYFDRMTEAPASGSRTERQPGIPPPGGGISGTGDDPGRRAIRLDEMWNGGMLWPSKARRTGDPCDTTRDRSEAARRAVQPASQLCRAGRPMLIHLADIRSRSSCSPSGPRPNRPCRRCRPTSPRRPRRHRRRVGSGGPCGVGPAVAARIGDIARWNDRTTPRKMLETFYFAITATTARRG
jgi:hypothetical protein